MNGTTIIAGGRIIDPANGLDTIGDVVCDDGLIVAVGPSAGDAYTSTGADIVDAAGLVVTPGLIDMHTHVFPGLGDFCLSPDLVGVESGVTTVIDAGTSGATTFEVSRRAYVDHPDVKTNVLCLLDPCQIYLANKGFICHHLRLADNEKNLDLDVTREVLERNGDVIVGFKVRACHTGDPNVSPFLEGAKSVAGDRPIMVHLGRFPHTPTIPTTTLLDALRAGDVITHAFRGASGVLDDERRATPQLIDAVERGVQLDVGHSGTDFRFRDARRLFELGFRPNTISTDLNVFNLDGPVFDLPTTMSKITALGLPLDEVIAMVTVNPARTIGREHEIGTLDVGRVADVSVLAQVEGPAELSDGYETVVADDRLVSIGCLRKGEWIPTLDRAAAQVPA